MKKFFASFLLLLFVVSGCDSKQQELAPIENGGNEMAQSVLTEVEAREIAEKTCIKGGESVERGTYNPKSKTWWFNANLNMTQGGCNPACVVSEESRTAEINWRCNGAIEEEEELMNGE